MQAQPVRYVYDGTSCIGEITGGTPTYYLPGLSATSATTLAVCEDNAQGSALNTVHPILGIHSRLEYDAFGQIYTIQDGYKSPFRFAGKHGYYTDEDTGMQLLGQRYYIPRIGRFITQDPIGQDGGLNLYEYCGNNPLTRFDPDGKDWEIGGFRFSWSGIWEGIKTGASAVGEAASFGIWRSEYYSQQPGYETSFALATGSREAAMMAGGMALGRAFAGARAARNITAYRSLNAAGDVDYIGITNKLARRAAEHGEKYLVRAIPGLRKLTSYEARGVEQALIEFHGLGKTGGTLLNRINSIAKLNPIYADSLRKGASLLHKAGYPGF